MRDRSEVVEFTMMPHDGGLEGAAVAPRGWVAARPLPKHGGYELRFPIRKRIAIQI
jgi:hypothetical protein